MTTKALLKKDLRLEKIQAISKLLGHESGEIVKSPCRGKYRGYNDYGIKFNTNDEIYLTMCYKNIDSELDNIINKINNFNSNKEHIMKYYKDFNIYDNKIALDKNLKFYELIDIKISNTSNHILWAYAIVKIDNKLRYIIETNFSFSVFNITKDMIFQQPERNYFVAGGLKDYEVDFVWHNVGMSTENDLYSLRQNEYKKLIY